MRAWFTFFLFLWVTTAQASILDTPPPGGGLMPLQGNTQLLPADQAFQAFPARVEGDKAVFELEIAPGYYAYHDKFYVADSAGARLPGLVLPAGEAKEDPGFGRVHILKGIVTASLSPPPKGTVVFGFQGCAERGVCYPAMTKASDLGGTADTAPLQDTHALWWYLLAGLGLAFTPCVLPTLPLLLRVVAGDTRSKPRSLLLASTFVVASSAGYALIGTLVSALGLGSDLQAHLQSPVVLLIATAVFVFLAMTLMDIRQVNFSLPTPAFIQNIYQRMSGGSALGAAGLGLVSTLVLSPCVSAPLAGILLYLAKGGRLLEGALSLFILGIGMGLPLMLIAVAGQSAIPRSGDWLGYIKKLYAALMLVTAGAIVSRLLSPQGTMVLVGISCAGFSVWLYALSGVTFRIIKVCAALLAAFALASLVGASKGHTNPLAPWQAPVIAPYVEVSSVQALKERIMASTGAHRAVMIDVSAQWCLNCKVIEARLLAPDVRSKLASKVDWVKFDITESTPETQAWLSARGLFGPPALVFIDSKGVENKAMQRVGEIEAADVVNQVNQI